MTLDTALATVEPQTVPPPADQPPATQPPATQPPAEAGAGDVGVSSEDTGEDATASGPAVRLIVPGHNSSPEFSSKEMLLLVLDQSMPSDQHPVRVYLAGLAPRSQRTMRGHLHTIARLLTSGRCDAFSLDWGRLRFQHVTAVRSALADTSCTRPYSYTTVNTALSGLRGVLTAAWNLGQMPTEDYHRAVAIKSVRGETLPRGRAVPAGELRALFTACATDKTPAGPRDAALLAVLYGAGVRRSEAVALDLSDYEPDYQPGKGQLRIRAGKGNKDRTAYATHGARAALEDWLLQRGREPGPLFLPVLKSGRLVPRRLTDQAVLFILQKRMKQAGIRHLSPHDLRRSFISDLLDAGADIATVKKLAGHANVTTTERYDRRGEVTKLRAAELLHVPYGS